MLGINIDLGLGWRTSWGREGVHHPTVTQLYLEG